MFKNKSDVYMKINNKKYKFVSNGVTEKRYLEKVKSKDCDVFYLDGSLLDKVEASMSYDDAVKLRGYLNEMIEVVEENKKEGNSMSKEYSLSEMIKAYEDGYKGQFQRQDGLTISNDNNTIMIQTNKMYITPANMKSKYFKIDKKATFEEAVKALRERKKIYYIDESGVKNASGLVNIDSMLRYEWYIEE